MKTFLDMPIILGVQSVHEKGLVGLRGLLGTSEVGAGTLGDADFEERGE